MQRLHDLYYNQGYQKGIKAVHYRVNAQHPAQPRISRREVTNWLRQQPTYQRNIQPMRPQHVKPILANRPGHIYQVDLQDFTNKPSMQFRYVLVVIDVFSRYVWARAITAKQPLRTRNALQQIVASGVELPRLLMTDAGGEFKGVFNEYLEAHNVKHIIGLGGRPETQGIVERVNQTLKRALARRGGAWHTALPIVVQQYNLTRHSTLKDTPFAVMHYNAAQRQALLNRLQGQQVKARANRRQVRLAVGDRVRLRRAKGQLEKRGTNNWSDEIYTVWRVWRARAPYATTRYSIEAGHPPVRYGSHVREDLLKIH